jgi:hypothetical protein
MAATLASAEFVAGGGGSHLVPVWGPRYYGS